MGGCGRRPYDRSGHLPAGGSWMRWVLRLIATGDDVCCQSTDLAEICRPDGPHDIANLGLSLLEAKQLLGSLQRAIVLDKPPATGCSGRIADPAASDAT